MSNYPTQDFVKDQMAAGKWPAKEDEVLDIRSLSDREVKILEMYNQEEIIKQLRKLNTAIAGEVVVNEVVDDVCDDGYDVDELADDVKDILSKLQVRKK